MKGAGQRAGFAVPQDVGQAFPPGPRASRRPRVRREVHEPTCPSGLCWDGDSMDHRRETHPERPSGVSAEVTRTEAVRHVINCRQGEKHAFLDKRWNS